MISGRTRCTSLSFKILTTFYLFFNWLALVSKFLELDWFEISSIFHEKLNLSSKSSWYLAIFNRRDIVCSGLAQKLKVGRFAFKRKKERNKETKKAEGQCHFA